LNRHPIAFTKKAANPMKTIRFERRDSVGSIVLANPPYNRIDARFPVTLREVLAAVQTRA
jgi:hypothetical protein